MTKMRVQLIVLITLLTIGCSNSVTEQHKETVQEDNYAIINLILPLVIEPDSSYRARNMMLLKSAATAEENTAADLYAIDSLKTVIENAPLYVFVSDTLTTYKDSPDHFLADVSTERLFIQNFPVDTSYRPLVRKLLAAAPPEVIDIKRLEKVNPYRLEPFSSRNALKDKVLEAGRVDLSRVTYNKDKTLACIYAGWRCGRLCGEGQLFFFHKQAGNWKVTGRKGIWIS
jgi:hypothetical protein